MKKPRITVSEYLTQQIMISGVAQKEIAEGLGYDKPNIITMFKQGRTKIPLNKVAPLAKILGVDPIHFLRLAMTEYSPETWEVLEGMLGQRLTSTHEQEILTIIRDAAGGHDVTPVTDDDRQQLAELAASWATREGKLAKAERTEL